MIASLQGTVRAISLDSAVIECNGVGYLVHAAPPTLATLTRGEDAFVLTSMIVREDAMTLYGFADERSRELFHLLQSVSGLGPRIGLAFQAVLTSEQVCVAIAGGDAKTLQKVPGVGKRLAERIIVELKDKVGGYLESDGGALGPDLSAPAPPADARADNLVAALTGLGFTEKQASAAVGTVLAESPGIDDSQALRLALKNLGSK